MGGFSSITRIMKAIIEENCKERQLMKKESLIGETLSRIFNTGISTTEEFKFLLPKDIQ